MTLYETVKGRTGKPETHTPMCNREGKNRNPIPMYPYTYVSMKGRTETQDPILAMNLRKGRTETQTHIPLKEKAVKGRIETQDPV